MITEFIVSSADIGTVFPAENHFILSLVRSRPPSQNCHYMNWADKHFCLRDSNWPQALFNIPHDFGRTPLVIGGAMYFLNNACLPIFGSLKLVACPFQSEWELTLSDVYVPPRKSLYKHHGSGYAPTGMWSGNRVPRARPVPPPPRQLELAAPPLQIAGPVTIPTERA